jgi:hypothetical protein
MTPILILPFLGTALGAAMVFLLRGAMSDLLKKLLLGFAAGVMVAASVWSLLIPSLEMAAEQGGVTWIPAAVGFVLGILFLLLLDTLIPHLHIGSDKPEGLTRNCQWKRTTMLSVAVTLHNIPEGMAVGVILASAMAEGSIISMSAAWALAIGIAMAIMAVSRIYFPEDIFLMICVFTSAIMLVVVYASVHSMEYECPLEWPAPYIYHKVLEDGKILKSEVCKSEDGRYDLCFTVADNNNRVTQAWCKGLEQVVRRDIKEWMVDLTAREVLIPYITN